MSKELEILKSIGRTFVSINNGIALDECDKYKTIEQALKEHEQYKAIEQELGIDLVTLFKALKNGFYYKDYEENPDGIISFVEKNDIMLKGNIGFNKIATYDSGCFMFKDYGKTWALTKEELEK